jgi:hypothetical protein
MLCSVMTTGYVTRLNEKSTCNALSDIVSTCKLDRSCRFQHHENSTELGGNIQDISVYTTGLVHSGLKHKSSWRQRTRPRQLHTVCNKPGKLSAKLRTAVRKLRTVIRIQLDHYSVLHRPLDRQLELFKGAEEIQGVSNVIKAGFVGSVFRQSSEK